MEKEMANGSSGMIMVKLKYRVSIIEVKKMENGLSGIIMVKRKNKEPSHLVKLIVYINIGLIMDT